MQLMKLQIAGMQAHIDTLMQQLEIQDAKLWELVQQRPEEESTPRLSEPEPEPEPDTPLEPESVLERTDALNAPLSDSDLHSFQTELSTVAESGTTELQEGRGRSSSRSSVSGDRWGRTVKTQNSVLWTHGDQNIVAMKGACLLYGVAAHDVFVNFSNVEAFAKWRPQWSEVSVVEGMGREGNELLQEATRID
jgi:hypothetical protein